MTACDDSLLADIGPDAYAPNVAGLLPKPIRLLPNRICPLFERILRKLPRNTPTIVDERHRYWKLCEQCKHNACILNWTGELVSVRPGPYSVWGMLL